MKRQTDRETERQKDGKMERWKTERRKDREMERWKDRKMER